MADITMIRFLKNLPHHFKTAFVGMIRHLAMTLSSMSAVMVTLSLIAVFMLIAGNLERFAQNVEGSLKIRVSVDKIANEEEVKQMEAAIKVISGVTDVQFSSKEKELATLIADNGSVFERYQDNNPMPDVYVVEVQEASLIPSVTEKLSEIPLVEEAQYGGETIHNMIDVFEIIRDGGSIFVGGLCILAVFLISSTIKLTIYTRNTEISIMRSVGATNGYIRTPFMIEGMFIGMIGSIVPILLTWAGYSLLYHMMDGQFLSSMFIMQKPFPYVLYISLLLLASGAVVGFLVSFLAVTRYLRWRR